MIKEKNRRKLLLRLFGVDSILETSKKCVQLGD